MKRITLMASMVLIVSATLLHSCKKKVMGCTDPSSLTYNSAATDDDGSCQYKGTATFWNDKASSLMKVTVQMADGTTGSITSDYSSAPSCGASGCFTYTAKPATYSYQAQEDTAGLWATYQTVRDEKSWTGSVTITSKGCYTLRLY